MVICGMRRLTYGLNSFLPGLTPNVLSRPKDGGLLVALFDSVLRASVIFTVAAEQSCISGPLGFAVLTWFLLP